MCEEPAALSTNSNCLTPLTSDRLVRIKTPAYGTLMRRLSFNAFDEACSRQDWQKLVRDTSDHWSCLTSQDIGNVVICWLSTVTCHVLIAESITSCYNCDPSHMHGKACLLNQVFAVPVTHTNLLRIWRAFAGPVTVLTLGAIRTLADLGFEVFLWRSIDVTRTIMPSDRPCNNRLSWAAHFASWTQVRVHV